MSTGSIVSSETWEEHKDAIVDLWKHKNCKMDKLINEMKRKGLVASKGQFGRQLKKWKITKNRSGNEWKHISNMLSRRSRQGKTSLVLIDGNEVDDGRLRKRTRAFEIPPWLSPGPTPEPMDGIEVCTPTTLIVARSSPSTSSQEALPEPGAVQGSSQSQVVRDIVFEGLPSVDFMEHFNQKGIAH